MVTIKSSSSSSHFVIKIFLGLSLLIPISTYSNSSHSSNATESTPTTDSAPITSNSKISPTNNKEIMIQWSRQLGVTCMHCHNLDNFNDDSKHNFKIALKHNQMVQILQQEVFAERDKGNVLKVKVDCYMCHRGKEMPAYIEPPLQLTK